jgi:hypothetical protein
MREDQRLAFAVENVAGMLEVEITLSKTKPHRQRNAKTVLEQ